MKVDVSVPNSSYGLCGCKATLKCNICVKVDVSVPNSSYGLCGRKATLNCNICVKVEVDVPGLPGPDSPSGLCGRP